MPTRSYSQKFVTYFLIDFRGREGKGGRGGRESGTDLLLCPSTQALAASCLCADGGQPATLVYRRPRSSPPSDLARGGVSFFTVTMKRGCV